jgi:hypothetical protein
MNHKTRSRAVYGFLLIWGVAALIVGLATIRGYRTPINQATICIQHSDGSQQSICNCYKQAGIPDSVNCKQ